MAPTGGISISGILQAYPDSGYTQIGPFTIAPGLANQTITNTVVATTATATTVPTGAVAVLIVPPVTNNVALNLTDSGGNIILILGNNTPSVISLNGTAQTLYMKCGSSTVTVECRFI